MSRYVNIENTTIMEEAETVGVMGGALLGAMAGAKIASHTLWMGGPAVYVGGVTAGAILGAAGGLSLGRLVAMRLES